MKMENQLKAAAPGVVERITTAAGRTVEKGEVLITFLGTPL
jgi:biotin carboxyl carrier protein